MTASFLGTELPIIQAPMAGVQRSRLAAAVAGAGGLGSLPASPPRQLTILTPKCSRSSRSTSSSPTPCSNFATTVSRRITYVLR